MPYNCKGLSLNFVIALIITNSCLFYFNRLDQKEKCFIYDVRFHGVNFPANGPIMQKKILGWEPSTEKMYARDGVLKGDVNMALRVDGGGQYRADFKSTYK